MVFRYVNSNNSLPIALMKVEAFSSFHKNRMTPITQKQIFVWWWLPYLFFQQMDDLLCTVKRITKQCLASSSQSWAHLGTLIWIEQNYAQVFLFEIRLTSTCLTLPESCPCDFCAWFVQNVMLDHYAPLDQRGSRLALFFHDRGVRFPIQRNPHAIYGLH